MNDLTYYSVVEAEDLGTFAKSEGKISNPLQTLIMIMFLVSLIWVSSWNTYKHLLASADYRQPWRMKVVAIENGSVIQFSHAKTGRYSPEFKLDHQVTQDYDVKIYNDNCQIPGVEVECLSEDKYPGFLKIKVNENVFLINSDQVKFNAKIYQWRCHEDA